MAGLGFKTFTAGEVLTAANVNGYLMEQAVMRFDSAAARSSAITSPSAGMLSFRADGTAVEVYDGSAWTAISAAGDISSVTAGYGLAGGGASGDVTISAGTTVTTTASSTYTLGTADAGIYLRFTSPATITVSTATDFPIGQQVQIFADGTALSITTDGATIAGAGTSTTSGTIAVGGQYEAVSVFCVDTDTYRIIGNVSAV